MNIAVIGCGNMASAVVLNLASNNKDLHFFTYTPSLTRAKTLAKKIKGQCIEKFEDFFEVKIDYWLIGHKPQQLDEFSKQFLKSYSDATIVSMLAATDTDRLECSFRSKNIIRIMPNTPIGVGAGVTLFYPGVDCSKDIAQIIKGHFKNAGLIETKSEKELDTLTTFSGCGPAYLFLFADTLSQKMQSLGFSKETSKALLDNLFLGSSQLMKNSTLNYTELLDQVTSKGGVTIQAIKTFQAEEIYSMTSKAIDSALRKTEQMNQVINK